MSHLDDVIQFRGTPSVGGQPLVWIEMLDGSPVPIEAWEPDPNTFHSGFYYNSRSNVLFKRVKANEGACSIREEYVWKRISERR